MVARHEAVITISQFISYSPLNDAKPTGIVYISGSLVIIKGQRKAVQFPKNEKLLKQKRLELQEALQFSTK